MCGHNHGTGSACTRYGAGQEAGAARFAVHRGRVPAGHAMKRAAAAILLSEENVLSIWNRQHAYRAFWSRCTRVLSRRPLV